MLGITRALLRQNRPEKAESPTEVTERADPLSTMMDEGSVEVGGWTEVKLPTSEVVRSWRRL
jgi:hypothetical protein